MVVKYSLYLTGKPRAHPPQGRQFTPLRTKGILEHSRTNWLKFALDFPLLLLLCENFIHAYPTNVVQNVMKVATNH